MILSPYSDEYPTINFNEDEIAAAFNRRAIKDRSMDGNKFESRQRWMGYLGEIALKYYLDSMEISYTHHNTETRKDLWDFSVPTAGIVARIDVKTTVRRRLPNEEDHAVVPYNQMDNPYNTLVFVSYDPILLNAYLVGRITKDNFKKYAKLLKKGEQDYIENFTATHSCYRIKLRELGKMRGYTIY